MWGYLQSGPAEERPRPVGLRQEPVLHPSGVVGDGKATELVMDIWAARYEW
ncbi:MAG: hypothetical protein ABSE77_13635 [Acidimicrobiales bacterium]